MTAQRQKLMKLEYRLSLLKEFEEKQERRKREEEQLLKFKRLEEEAAQERYVISFNFLCILKNLHNSWRNKFFNNLRQIFVNVFIWVVLSCIDIKKSSNIFMSHPLILLLIIIF